MLHVLFRLIWRDVNEYSRNKILNEINDYQHHNYMKIKQIKNIIK